MSDPFRDRPGDSAHHLATRDRRTVGWTIGLVAILALLGVSYWAWNESAGSPTANPPAVTAAPAPATGVPAPRPETTTGQAPSPAR
ncbi:MAG: hypothetical protein ACJ8F3_11110 [Xanthobacteraceae bacterium]